jgi:hypothetical protein
MGMENNFKPNKGEGNPKNEGNGEKTLEEKSKDMAEELKSGKRKWYTAKAIMEPGDNFNNEVKFFALPLEDGNLNEMGHMEKELSDMDTVKSLLDQGKIENDYITKLIFKNIE